jgi:hypothetical protein
LAIVVPAHPEPELIDALASHWKLPASRSTALWDGFRSALSGVVWSGDTAAEAVADLVMKVVEAVANGAVAVGAALREYAAAVRLEIRLDGAEAIGTALSGLFYVAFAGRSSVFSAVVNPVTRALGLVFSRLGASTRVATFLAEVLIFAGLDVVRSVAWSTGPLVREFVEGSVIEIASALRLGRSVDGLCVGFLFVVGRVLPVAQASGAFPSLASRDWPSRAA